MIYKTLGAGLVTAPQPDTSALMKGALPDVTKLKAAAWGIPELDDIKAPELQYEKDLDTRVPEKLDEYYQKGQQLMNNATKLRSVGIDVTNPDPYVEGSIEASSLWSKDYNDWLQLGQQLKQSKKKIEEYNTQLRNPNAIVNPLPEGQLIEDVNKYTMEVDRKPMDALQKVFSNTYNKYIYDRKNLDQRAKEAAQAEKALTEQYDMLIAQNPNFKNKLEGEKQLYLASMLEPIYDTAFAEKLQTEREKLQQRKKEFDWEQYKWGKEFGYKTDITEAGVKQSFIDLYNNKKSKNFFDGLPIGQTLYDEDGNKYQPIIKDYLGKETRNGKEYMNFRIMHPDGRTETLPVQYSDEKGDVVIQDMKVFKKALENAIKTKAPYTVGEEGEVPVGSKTGSGTSSGYGGYGVTPTIPTPQLNYNQAPAGW